MDAHVRTARYPLSGELRVPSDKSLSHRAVLFAAMAEGTSTLSGVLDSADVRATIGAVSALGAVVDVRPEEGGSLAVTVHGWGAMGPVAPSEPIDCGNSGTTARLLLGVLAGWDVEATLVGDESLSRRPMRRVAEPLAAMGAHVFTAEGGGMPVIVRGTPSLLPIDYPSPVASAQVKTALLLAGTRAAGTTCVTEPAMSRDHTERLLPAFGVPVAVDADARRACVSGPASLAACDVRVPADPSSAAFVVVAALGVTGSDVVLADVCLNPTRSGFLRVLTRMGADVRIDPGAPMGTEPVGVVRARAGAALEATTVGADEVPSLVDEVPVLAVAATLAHGTTRFSGVGELRVKESDRLAALADGLERLGAVVRAGEDWLEIVGPVRLRGTRVSAQGDHRLAMAWAVAALLAEGETVIEGFESVDVSYPGFLADLEALGVGGSLG